MFSLFWNTFYLKLFSVVSQQFGNTAKELPQQKATALSSILQQNQSHESRQRGNSFDSSIDKEESYSGFGVGKWPAEPSITYNNEMGGLTRSNSDELVPFETNVFGRKDGAPSNVFSRNSNSFGMKGSGTHTSSVTSFGEGPNYNAGASTRNTGIGNLGRPQMSNNIPRGTNHNNLVR